MLRCSQVSFATAGRFCAGVADRQRRRRAPAPPGGGLAPAGAPGVAGSRGQDGIRRTWRGDGKGALDRRARRRGAARRGGRRRPRRGAGRDPLQRHQPRHRGAGLARGRAARRAGADAGAAAGGQLPLPGEVRLRGGRPGGARGRRSWSGATSSCCIRTRTASRRRRPWRCRCRRACRPARAVLAANMETALNIVWDAGASAGDRIAVVGRGHGRRAGRLALRPAAGNRGDAGRREPRARRAGGGARLRLRRAGGGAGGLRSRHPRQRQRRGAGHGARRRPGSRRRWSRRAGTATARRPSGSGGAFHSRRLRLISSQVGLVPTERRARWSNRRRLEAALRLLADPGARRADQRRDRVRRPGRAATARSWTGRTRSAIASSTTEGERADVSPSRSATTS